MKIRKHFTLIALIAILGIAITACDNDNGNLNGNLTTECTEHDWDWTANAIAATCTEASKDTATCKIPNCNKTNERAGSVLALGHTGSLTGAIAATCTTEGNTGTGTCTRCSAALTGNVTPIDENNHAWSSWTEKTAADCITAKVEKRNCTRTGCTTPEETQNVGTALGHDGGEWFITKDQSITETGTKELRCTKCAYVLETNTIPMIILHRLWLGTLPVVVADKTGELTSERVVIFQNSLETFSQSTVAPDMAAMGVFNNRGNSLSIIIEDVPSYGTLNYRIINGRTFAMRSDIVSNPINNLTSDIIQGLRAISGTPLPDCCSCKYLPCDCISKDCFCVPVPFGQLNAAFGVVSEQIPVFMTAGVTEAQMTAAIANIQAGYNGLDALNRLTLMGKIKEIRVVPADGPVNSAVPAGDGKFIITFRENRTESQIRSHFGQWISQGVFQ